jgi:hypothetical protein
VPVAALEVADTCAAMAATAAKTRPVSIQPSPKTQEPPAGSPEAMSDRAVRDPMAAIARVASTRAAASGARRPTTVAPSSSSRPASSSLRVWRTTSTMASTASIAVPSAVIFTIDSAPSVGSQTRP